MIGLVAGAAGSLGVCVTGLEACVVDATGAGATTEAGVAGETACRSKKAIKAVDSAEEKAAEEEVVVGVEPVIQRKADAAPNQ